MIEDKTEKHDDGLSKSRTPIPKKTQSNYKGNTLGISGAKYAQAAIDQAFLHQTTNIELQTGALGAGLVNDEEETTTKSKSKKKYIIRHLISGRIMMITK